MEKLYEDFTNNLLPQIQDGLVITKDYFIDLFGRYVQFLILTDGIYFAIGVIGLIVTIIGSYKSLRYFWSGDSSRDSELTGVVCAVALIPVTVFTAMIFWNGINLIKSIYIPEVRIYEQIKLQTND